MSLSSYVDNLSGVRNATHDYYNYSDCVQPIAVVAVTASGSLTGGQVDDN